MGCGLATGKKPITSCKKIETIYGSIYIPLTSGDIKDLKASWPLVKQHWLAVCAVAFERWFSIYPELRYMFRRFPQPTEMSLEELLQSEMIKVHVDKLQQAIDGLLSIIDTPVEFVNGIIASGVQHYHFNAEQQYATHLAAALQYAVTKTIACSPDIENAWDSLLRFVMDCLKLGMRMEKQKVSRELQIDSEN